MYFMEKNNFYRTPVAIGYCFILIIFGYTLSLFKNIPFISDEYVHYEQIRMLLEGEFLAIHPSLTNFPGYHLFYSAILYFFQPLNTFQVRIANTLINSLLFFIAYNCIQKLKTPFPVIRALQITFLPILFPLTFLVYTDILSVIFVVAGFLCALSGLYTRAQLILIAAFFIRQPNIIWLAFIIPFQFISLHGLSFHLNTTKEHLKHSIPAILGICIFLGFVALHGQVAVHQSVAHPAFEWHVENIFFALFLMAFLFFPHCLQPGLQKIKATVQSRLFWIVILLFTTTYFLFFLVHHPYNSKAYSYHLRNVILHFFMDSPGGKFLFLLPVLFTLCTLRSTILVRVEAYLFYPATILFLLPSWLIEQRYYLIPYVLYIIFRKPSSKWIEVLLLVLFLLGNGILLKGIKEGRFFL